VELKCLVDIIVIVDIQRNGKMREIILKLTGDMDSWSSANELIKCIKRYRKKEWKAGCIDAQITGSEVLV